MRDYLTSAMILANAKSHGFRIIHNGLGITRDAKAANRDAPYCHSLHHTTDSTRDSSDLKKKKATCEASNGNQGINVWTQRVSWI